LTNKIKKTRADKKRENLLEGEGSFPIRLSLGAKPERLERRNRPGKTGAGGAGFKKKTIIRLEKKNIGIVLTTGWRSLNRKNRDD